MKRIVKLSILFLVAGCSVQHKEVPNNPPPYKEFQFSNPEMVGAFRFESASFFLWPNDVSEAELTSMKTIARTNSKKLDGLSIETDKAKNAYLHLEDMFFGRSPHDNLQEVIHCVTAWAELGKDEDPEFVEWVSKWKKLEPVSEVPPEDPKYPAWLEYLKNLKALTTCQDNQTERKKINEKLDKTLGEQKDLIDEIYKAVDKGYPLNPKNLINVNALESNGLFSQDGTIELFFKDFDGQDQKAYEVSYSKKRMLSFKLKKSESGRETGAYYSFKLERAPNFVGRIRLVGEVFLIENGVKTRNGQAKIDGFLSQE